MKMPLLFPKDYFYIAILSQKLLSNNLYLRYFNDDIYVHIELYILYISYYKGFDLDITLLTQLKNENELQFDSVVIENDWVPIEWFKEMLELQGIPIDSGINKDRIIEYLTFFIEQKKTTTISNDTNNRLNNILAETDIIIIEGVEYIKRPASLFIFNICQGAIDRLAKNGKLNKKIRDGASYYELKSVKKLYKERFHA